MTVIEELRQRGFSKYKIAQKTGVSWNTVHLWVKGIYNPNPEHLRGLKELLELTKPEDIRLSK